MDYKLLGLLLSLTTCLQLSVGAPRQKRQLPHTIRYEMAQCVPFKQHYCNKMYNHTVFPSPARPDLSLEKLEGEFNDFIPLLRDNCHEKIGIFLCFLYFPLCNKTNFLDRLYSTPNTLPSDVGILPCLETCESVTHPDSNCTAIVNSVVGEWVEHLRCNYTVHNGQRKAYKPMTNKKNCVDGISPLYTENRYVEDEGSAETTEPIEEPQTTKPIEEPQTTTQAKEECPEADYRSKCTANIFKNNCWKYAARVEVTALGVDSAGKRTINAAVVTQYDLESPTNSEEHTVAPQMDNSIVLKTNWYPDCSECPEFEIGTEYLVAGHYSQSEDGSVVTWKLHCDNNDSIVTKIAANRKCGRRLEDWVESSNTHRKSMEWLNMCR